MANKYIELGEWLPDRHDVYGDGLSLARNVVSVADGYWPMRDFLPKTDPLPSQCMGAIGAYQQGGLAYIYAGTGDALYSLSGSTWTEVGSGYAPSEERWRFRPWLGNIYAAKYGNVIQHLDAGVPPFADLANAPQARHLAVVADHLIAGYVFDEDGLTPNRIRWCGYRDPTAWAVDPLTGADFQDLQSKYGVVRALFGGEFGVVFQDLAISTIEPAGSPLVYQILPRVPQVGILADDSAVQDGRTIYFLSTDGFMRLDDGATLTPIGANKVDEWFFDDIESGSMDQVIGTYYKRWDLAYWLYARKNGDTGLIMYHTRSGRWSYSDDVAPLEMMANAGAPPISLDDLTTTRIDDMMGSLDDSSYAGTANGMMVFDKLHRGGSLSGASLRGEIVTRSLALTSPRVRSMIKRVKPVIEGGAGEVAIESSDELSMGYTRTGYRPCNPHTHVAAFRQMGRFHRIVIRSDDFRFMTGLDVEYVRRGGAN